MTIVYARITNAHSNLLLAVAAIYMDCFENSEWQEKWTLLDALAVFQKALANGHDVVFAFDRDNDDQVIGFAIGHPMKDVKDADRAILISTAGIPEASYWVSDIGVFAPYRKHHVAKGLLLQLFDAAVKNGHKDVATRTLVGCAGERLFFRSDFQSRGVFEFETGGSVSGRYVLHRPLPPLVPTPA